MNEQTAAFLLSVLCGMVGVLLWAVSDAARKSIRINMFFSILLDFVWCFAILSLFSVCMWKSVSLSLRFFELAGFGLGVILYRFLLYLPTVTLFCFIFCTIFKFIKFIFKILLTPCVFLYKILIRVFIFKRR